MTERAATAYDNRIYTADWRDWQDPDLPEWMHPIDHLIGRHVAAGNGDRIAIRSREAVLTYAELAQKVALFAGALGTAGARPGERLLMFGNDSVEFVCLWLGAIQFGVVPVVISDLYKSPELNYFLTDTGAATLFIDEEQLAKLTDEAAALPHSLNNVIVRGAAGEMPDKRIAIHSLDALLAASAPADDHWRWHSNDICYMFYSGGTTGRAKGITHLTHDFWLIPARQGAFWSFSSDDVVYATSRKYFTHGLWPGLLIPLAAGASMVLDRRPLNAGLICDLIAEHRVTKLISVPTILKMLTSHARGASSPPDFSTVSLVISASEKISPEVFESFHGIFGVEILDSIGSSEVTYEWIANRPEEMKRGSLGKPVFGYEIRLVDNEGHDVTEPGAVGEAWVRSRTACMFYWRKYDQSRATFIGGWTRTGDNLSFDEDGFFWFAGRENDVFKVKGLWVSPIEIEAAIAAHPAVLEAAVVSYTGDDGLTSARCYLVPDGQVSDPDVFFAELSAAVQPLGGYKVPAEFRIVSHLPRTTLSKVDRRYLRENPDFRG